VQRIEQLGKQLGCGLLHLHQQDFVHRDIKPSNLLVMNDDRLVVADFGSARVAFEGLNGTMVGTTPYIGPEGPSAAGFPRDIFAAGCVLVEAVLQEQPNIDKRKRNDQKQRSLEIAGDQGSELLAQTIKTALHEIPWCRPKASSFMIPMDPANAAVSFGEACSEPTDTEVVTYITSLVTKGKTPEGVHKLCKDAPAAIRNNERCMLATVRKNGCLLEYASTTMRKHKKIILAAVQQNGAALKFALPFEADRVFLEQLMPESGAGSLDDQDFYRAFFLKAVQRDGHYLMFASRSLRNDMDLVVAATKNNPKVLMYASAALQEELRQRPPVPEVIQDIPKRQPSWLGWLRRISRGGG